MKKIIFSISKFLIAVVFLSTLQVQEVRASHAMGADLTYECLGPNQYRLTYSFYRDCDGISAPATVSVNYTSSCFGGGIVVLSPIPGSPSQISATCPNVATTCNGGTYTGIEEWIYSGIVNLPGPCADWKFSYGECCRNAAITTVSSASSNDLYVYSLLNSVDAPCNNSPTFSNKPVPFACVGQRFCFNHGASDVDGDSITYQLITPLDDANTPITYLPPFSNTQPVMSAPPVIFNSISGDICMVPTRADVTVFAVLVSEYRNGVLIGQVERDIQLTVNACNNFLPNLTGMNGQPYFSKKICANVPFEFWVASIDADLTDTTYIDWDFGIAGASFTPTATTRDSAYFSWTPTTADISNSPYCFTATVRDNHCPYLGLQVFSFCFTVCGVEADAGLDQVVTCGATTNLTGTATSGCGPITYRWLPSGTAGASLNGVGVGDYFLEATAGVETAFTSACKDTDMVSVLPGIDVAVSNFNFTTNCSGLPVQFTDASINAVSWSWDFGDLTTSNLQNPSHTFASNGTYTVKLVVSSPTGCLDSLTQQVVINTNIPTASFSAPPVCVGATSNFTDLTAGGPIATWSWNFNDPASGANNTSALQNPNHIFTGPGTYQVTLNATNTSGCSHQVQQNVVVHANPVVSVPDDQVCIGDQITLTAPAGFTSYSWTPGGNTQSITISPVVNTAYSLTVVDANTCQANDVVNVVVNPLPVVLAGADQTICEGTSASLSGIGGGPGGVYVWNPGNIVGQNISVSPVVTTDYVLTATDALGCANTDQMRVTVNPMPVVDAGNDGGICKGGDIVLSASAGGGNYLWSPGGFTTASITVSPAITTTYTVTVSDGIGCAGIDQVTVVVNPIPVASFNTSAPVCVGNSVSFTDLSNVSTGTINYWSWIFGNGQSSAVQNPSVTYNGSGAFNVKLLVSSNAGCLDSISNMININPLPVANAGVDAGICPGDNATLSGSGGTQYLWSPGGFTTALINVSPASTTNYTLEVTDANGCKNTDQAQVVVNPVPVANAGVDQDVCLGDATSLSASGIGDYTWTPGNVNGANYNVNPAITTTYTVRVVNAFGCEDSDEVTVNVNPIPVSSFNSTGSVCQYSNVGFNDMSGIQAGSISSWAWDLGNGILSTLQNPTLTYNSAGTFTISLSVTSDKGCTASSNQTLSIWAEPVASFTNTNVCEGLPIQFTNTTTISDASPLSYSWNLGDGNSSVNASPTHLYAGYGTYQAHLEVTSSHGCINRISRAVNVFALPTASFAFDPACEDSPAQFNDLSTIPDGNVSSWYWTFGDGSIGTLPSPSHTYADPGSYPIHLLISSNHGCKDSTNGMIRIIPRPVVDFTTESACQGTIVQLTDQSFPITGSIVQYTWNFGDGSNSTMQNPAHLYSSWGWYEVALTVVTDSGCATTMSRPNALQIYRAPDALFTSSAAEANDVYPLVSFVNETRSPGFYYWNFGDGTVSEDYSPTHMYPDVGVYDVQLITIDLNGCVDSIMSRVEIRPSSTIYIPNAFTPNGDKRNDLFKVYTNNVVRLEAQVFDRWGLKVYEWDSLEGGWDGIVKGNPVQADVYVYRVSTVDVNNKRETRIGHVSLVR
jgi:gliding motility-associated-like protein